MAAGQVGYFTSRTHALSLMCSHLQINPFVRRMQELLLPEHVVHAVAYAQAINGVWNSPGPARG